MLSKQFSNRTPSSWPRAGVLLMVLLTGCLLLVPCFASTYEDLSEPPKEEALVPVQAAPKLTPTAPVQPKPLVPAISGSAEKTNLTPPQTTKQAGVGQVPSSVNLITVPQAAPGKQATGKEEAEKITAAREKVMAISRRADQLKNESELTLSDTELTISSPRRIQPVDVLLRPDAGASWQADSPSPSSSAASAQSGVSAIELNKIRQQLEMGENGRKLGVMREKEDATSHSGEEPRPHDLNLRLPPMQ